MALQLKQKLCKRKQLLKLFAINSLIYITMFIVGLVSDSITLAVLLHPSRQSKSNTISTIFFYSYLSLLLSLAFFQNCSRFFPKNQIAGLHIDRDRGTVTLRILRSVSRRQICGGHLSQMQI